MLRTQATQKGLEAVRNMGLLEKGCEFTRTERGILIPLMRKPSTIEINNLRAKLGSFEIEQADFQSANPRSKNLRSLLPIPQELRSKVPRSFDLIGDIAIVEIPATLTSFSTEIGNAILEINPHIRLVIQKSSGIMGPFRTRKFQTIAGSGTTETVYNEFSCHYKLDVAAVYFNPRLSHERIRVARQVRKGEVVVDMFAGVGPYSILIAKSEPTSKVYSIDINPAAVRYLKENLFLNRVADRVIPLSGNVRQLSMKEVRNVADRVIMNLPSEAVGFIDAAIRILREKAGRVHFYQFAQRDASIDSIKDSFRSVVEAQNGAVESFEFCNAIKEISPGMVQIAIDAVIK
jgi:tRNA (guanine37-N1)-methyltransferase